jgi:hypothetical protein
MFGAVGSILAHGVVVNTPVALRMQVAAAEPENPR